MPSRFSVRQLARQFCGLAWSPNGKFLAFPDRESPESPRSIFLLDVETREKRKLTTPPAEWTGDGLSVFSPDGRSLAFARTQGGFPSDIYVLALSENGEPRGEPRPITKDGKDDLRVRLDRLTAAPWCLPRTTAACTRCGGWPLPAGNPNASAWGATSASGLRSHARGTARRM